MEGKPLSTWDLLLLVPGCLARSANKTDKTRGGGGRDHFLSLCLLLRLPRPILLPPFQLVSANWLQNGEKKNRKERTRFEKGKRNIPFPTPAHSHV